MIRVVEFINSKNANFVGVVYENVLSERQKDLLTSKGFKAEGKRAVEWVKRELNVMTIGKTYADSEVVTIKSDTAMYEGHKEFTNTKGITAYYQNIVVDKADIKPSVKAVEQPKAEEVITGM